MTFGAMTCGKAAAGRTGRCIKSCRLALRCTPAHFGSSSFFASSFRPLTVLTFRLQYQWHGYQFQYFHLANLALHALVCVLATLLLLQECGSSTCGRWTVAAAATLFAVHPVHTEVVSNMTGRCEPLCCALILASLLCYSWSVPQPPCVSASKCSHVRQPWILTSSLPLRRCWLGASLFLVCIATLAKETALVAPAVLLAYEVIRGFDAVVLVNNNNDSAAHSSSSTGRHESDASVEQVVLQHDSCLRHGDVVNEHVSCCVGMRHVVRRIWCTVCSTRGALLCAFALVLYAVRVVWLVGGYVALRSRGERLVRLEMTLRCRLSRYQLAFSDFHNPLVSVTSRYQRFLSISFIHVRPVGDVRGASTLMHSVVALQTQNKQQTDTGRLATRVAVLLGARACSFRTSETSTGSPKHDYARVVGSVGMDTLGDGACVAFFHVALDPRAAEGAGHIPATIRVAIVCLSRFGRRTVDYSVHSGITCNCRGLFAVTA